MRKYILTWVVGLAIDEPVKAPTSKTYYDQVHDQIEKQQRSCYVSSHRRHIFLPFTSWQPIETAEHLFSFLTNALTTKTMTLCLSLDDDLLVRARRLDEDLYRRARQLR